MLLLRAIRGRVGDTHALRRELAGGAGEGPGDPDRPGAIAGVSGSGMFVGLFDIGGAGRPAESFWERLGGLLDGATTTDHPHVHLVSEATGAVASVPVGTVPVTAVPVAVGEGRFIRVTWGRTTDRAALWALRRRLASRLPDARPDLLGLLSAATERGWLVEAACHESEELTHAADRGAQEPEMAEILDGARGLVTVAATDILRDLWLRRPFTTPGRDGQDGEPDRGRRPEAATAAPGPDAQAVDAQAVDAQGVGVQGGQSSSGISSHHWHHQSPPTRIRSFGCQQ
ncbi:hypothetical protein [Parafrankia elaeagni]|uniref:hypothetical protein n=1 Tax=Parafrankia elaeagni TaxID=222534 RepID=UPI0003786ECA|nr:hypothetical protein [Parafrankia elaeagni]